MGRTLWTVWSMAYQADGLVLDFALALRACSSVP